MLYITVKKEGKYMNIIISNSSSTPIYEQIKQSIKKGISNGELQENEMLPSIRNLARDLRISILTVKKAYDELEKEHYIVTIQGKGSYITPQTEELIKEKQLQEIEKHIDSIVAISKISNISKQEILEIFNYLYGEEI